jgi:HD-GYP domain-containing protein (c-di-GMP phosphodiesterase class II)
MIGKGTMQSGLIKDKIEDLVTRLARTIQVNRIYGKDHALTLEAADSLYKILNDLLLQKEDVTLGVIGDEIAFEKEPLYELSTRRKQFIDFLKLTGVKKMSFSRGISKKELLDFCLVLTARLEPNEQKRSFGEMLSEKGIAHVSTGEIGVKEKRISMPMAEDRIRDVVKQNYQSSVHLLTKTFQELKGNQPLNAQSARQIVEGLIKNLLQNKNLLLILTSLKTRDENTFMHGINVAIFTLLQGEVLGLEEKYLVDVGMSAMLHDVGKLSLSAEQTDDMSAWAADKPESEQSDREEADQDVAGAKILLETEGINVLAAITAFEHNIKYDMTGPQRKLYGRKLNLVSMMIAISDYYDKLRRRPTFYEAGGPEKAYEDMMKLSGTHFHPDLLKNFFSALGVFPPGTLVELDSKEIALVIQSSMLDVKRPQVEILYDQTGEKYKEPKIVNLVEKDKRGQYKRSIVKSISPIDRFQVPDKYA